MSAAWPRPASWPCCSPHRPLEPTTPSHPGSRRPRTACRRTSTGSGCRRTSGSRARSSRCTTASSSSTARSSACTPSTSPTSRRYARRGSCRSGSPTPPASRRWAGWSSTMRTPRSIAETGETAFGRSEILTIVVGTAREIDYWSGYANVGGNIRSGNSDQIDYTARLGTMRRSVRNRTAFDYIGTITRIDDVDTSNNHRVTVGWDHFLSKRWFVNVVGLEWYRDPFQNVADRWTVTAGLGYEIIDTPRTSWSVTAGPAWQSTEWDSAPAGSEDSADSLALRIGTRFDHDFTKVDRLPRLLQRVLHRRGVRHLHPPLRHGGRDRADRRLRRQRRLGVGPGPGSAAARGRQLPEAGRHPAHLRPRLVLLAASADRPCGASRDVRRAGVAFGHTVLTMAYAVGHISGGHFNPAVTVGPWAGGRFKASEILPCWVARRGCTEAPAGAQSSSRRGAAGVLLDQSAPDPPLEARSCRCCRRSSSRPTSPRPLEHPWATPRPCRAGSTRR